MRAKIDSVGHDVADTLRYIASDGRLQFAILASGFTLAAVWAWLS
jgi:hypothetical protein